MSKKPDLKPARPKTLPPVSHAWIRFTLQKAGLNLHDLTADEQRKLMFSLQKGIQHYMTQGHSPAQALSRAVDQLDKKR